VLVVGGTGYVGRLVCAALHARGVVPAIASRTELGAGFERLEVADDVEAIVHLARPADDGHDAPLRRLLAIASARDLPIVHLGSSAERSGSGPTSAYARGKRRQRALMRRSGVRHVHVCCGIVHPGNPRLRADLPAVVELIRRFPRVGDAVLVDCVHERVVSEAVAELTIRVLARSLPSQLWAPREVHCVDQSLTLADLVRACDGDVPAPGRHRIDDSDAMLAAADACLVPPVTTLRVRFARYLRLAAAPGRARRRGDPRCPPRAPDHHWRGPQIDFAVWLGRRSSLLRRHA
jgi:uncharacterized protein YbjT (DUF2867 family)